MGTVYWLLHAPEADMHNGFYDRPEAVKNWRAWWLPRLAAAVREERDAWQKEAALPWFFAILAHAASDAGINPPRCKHWPMLAIPLGRRMISPSPVVSCSNVKVAIQLRQ